MQSHPSPKSARAIPFITFSLVNKTSIRWECAPPDPPPTRPQHSLHSLLFSFRTKPPEKNKRDLAKIRTRITRNGQVSILPYIINVISPFVQGIKHNEIKLNAESLSWQIRQEIVSLKRIVKFYQASSLPRDHWEKNAWSPQSSPPARIFQYIQF